jgi:alpha-glucoside transport system permease protein
MTYGADSAWNDAAVKFGNMFGAIALFVVVIGLIFLAAGRAQGRGSRPLALVVLLGPALLLVTIGLVIPAIRTIYLSFFNSSSAKYVGFDNYVWSFTNSNNQRVMINTLLWIIVAPFAATGLGLALALLVDRMRQPAVWKSLIFMPTAISFVGASIIWKFIYDSRDPSNPQIGLLSQLVIALGWKHPPNWILSSPLNTFLLMVIMVWVQTGFAVVVLSAAIRAIPTDVIEAARVDGAYGRKLYMYVMIPMIRNTLVVVLTTIMIITLKVFDIIRTMTGGNFNTEVLSNAMYSQSFVQFNTGRGSALAVILFAGVLPLVIYNIIVLRKERSIR